MAGHETGEPGAKLEGPVPLPPGPGLKPPLHTTCYLYINKYKKTVVPNNGSWQCLHIGLSAFGKTLTGQ